MNFTLSFVQCLVSLVLFASFAHGQTIKTIAGSGIVGYWGDGGPALVAEMQLPAGIDKDNNGNIYFAEPANQCIRKVAPSGIIYTVAGNGTYGFTGDGGQATAATFRSPNDVLIDGIGNMYIADMGNDRVRKVNAMGIVTTIAGNGTPGYAGDGGTATAASLNHPHSLALDVSGNLYIADRYNNCIRKISTSGLISTVAGTGVIGYSGDGGPATAAQLNDPVGIILDGIGNLFISDGLNYRIRKVNVAGNISTFAGNGILGYTGDGVQATATAINPVGLMFDNYGNLFVSDEYNSRIRMISTSGIITTIAGSATSGFSGDGGPATVASLFHPQETVLSCGGNLFFSDHHNQRIRVVLYANDTPQFTHGLSQSFVMCGNSGARSLDTLLTIGDTDTGQVESWAPALVPAHGTLASSYTAFSTGSPVMPSGLSYTPALGYYGPDTFRVRVSDCVYLKDSTIFYVTVNNCALGTATYMAGNTVVNESLNVYPNPGTDIFTVNLSSDMDEEVRIVITNVLGERICETAAYTNKAANISLRAAPGFYFVSVSSSRARHEQRLLINR